MLDWTRDPGLHAWIRPRLRELRILADPTLPGGIKSPEIFVRGKGSGVALCWHASQQLLVSSHVWERDKGFLRGVLVGGVWNRYFLGQVHGETVPCRFCGGLDGDGHLFWDCPYPLPVW